MIPAKMESDTEVAMSTDYLHLGVGHVSSCLKILTVVGPATLLANHGIKLDYS
jgi:hypothetical protein